MHRSSTEPKNTKSHGLARLSRILHPTDFSAGGERAFDHAVLLSRLAGAELHLLHVVGYPEDLRPTEATLKKTCAACEKRLADLGAAVEGVSSIQVAVRIGSPHVEVIDYAHQAKVDLVVMGTVGLSSDPKNPVGSTAEKVIRALDIPVLTVKAKPRAAKAAGRVCSMCGQSSSDILCNGCKERIRGEALYRSARP